LLVIIFFDESFLNEQKKGAKSAFFKETKKLN